MENQTARQAFIQWARAEQNRISEESMQRRQQYEAILSRMNLELGEANGEMRMLDKLIQQAEDGNYPWLNREIK